MCIRDRHYPLFDVLIKCKNLGCRIHLVGDLYEYSSFDDKYHPFQNLQRMITIFMLTTKAISVCKIPRCIFKKENVYPLKMTLKDCK